MNNKKKKYAEEQDELIKRKLKDINKNINRFNKNVKELLNIKTGSAENWEKYHKLAVPMREIQKMILIMIEEENHDGQAK